MTLYDILYDIAVNIFAICLLVTVFWPINIETLREVDRFMMRTR